MQSYWTEHTQKIGDITIESDGERITAVYWGLAKGSGQNGKNAAVGRSVFPIARIP